MIDQWRKVRPYGGLEIFAQIALGLILVGQFIPGSDV